MLSNIDGIPSSISQSAIPTAKRALLDSAYEVQSRSAKLRQANAEDMGFKEMVSFLGSSGPLFASHGKAAQTRHHKSSEKHSGRSLSEIEVFVNTKDATAALEALKSATAAGNASSEVRPADRHVTRDSVTGAVMEPSIDEDGEEDDRWFGDGMFAVNMHHRCRPFVPTIEPLELMVQLDLVPQPLPGGEEMPGGLTSPTRANEAMKEACPPGFRNSSKYSVWSNAAHSFLEDDQVHATSSASFEDEGVIDVQRG